MRLHHLYRESEGQTDSEEKTVLGFSELAGNKAICFITTALRAFLLVSKLEQRRNSIIYHSGAKHLLIYTSNTGVAFGAKMVHLVTGLSVGGVYKG